MSKAGFKQAQIGDAPMGWDLKKLGDVLTLQRGFDLPLRVRQAGKIPIVSSGGISGEHNEAKAKGPGIVTGRYGTIGEVFFLEEDFWPLNTTLYVKDFKGNHPRYLFYLLQTIDFDQHSGKSGIPGINRNDIHQILVLCPPLPEQKEIARILSLWDAAIRDTTQLVAAKTRLKRALMQQLLSGARRFPEFEDQAWRTVALGDVLREESRYVDWDDEAIYQLLSIRRRSGGFFFRDALQGKKILTKVMKVTQTGDFVIARMQAVHGAFSTTPPHFDDYNVSDSYTTFVARDENELFTPFLDFLSHLPKFYSLVLRSAYGISIEKMTFNVPWFLKETISIPPTIAEQKRIAQVLAAATQEIATLEKQRQVLAQQKRGLMQKLLRGEVRVSNL